MALNNETKNKVMQDFKISAQDSGSADVQIALLTERIRALTDHLQNNKKDFSSKHGLLKMISRRNKFMKYLQRVDQARYRNVIKKLDLKG